MVSTVSKKKSTPVPTGTYMVVEPVVKTQTDSGLALSLMTLTEEKDCPTGQPALFQYRVLAISEDDVYNAKGEVLPRRKIPVNSVVLGFAAYTMVTGVDQFHMLDENKVVAVLERG